MIDGDRPNKYLLKVAAIFPERFRWEMSKWFCDKQTQRETEAAEDQRYPDEAPAGAEWHKTLGTERETGRERETEGDNKRKQMIAHRRGTNVLKKKLI